MTLLRYTRASLSIAALILGSIAGCAPSPTSSGDSTSFTDPGAQYWQNVSGMVLFGPPVKGMSVYEFQWKDSNGVVRSIGDYKGKAILVGFSTNEHPEEFAALDSVQDALGDSVRVIGISVTKTFNSFLAVKQFVQTSKVKLQVVVDSSDRSQVLYVEQSGNTATAIPQTFVIDPHGEAVLIHNGPVTHDTLVSDVRNAYK